MQCLHPLLAYFPFKTRKLEIIGQYNGDKLIDRIADKNGKWFQIPCGKCINCRVNRANDWKKRILKECEKYEYNHFITLTYNDLHLPGNHSLVKKDVQKFFKRLRRFLEYHGITEKIKYFCSGEYGDKTRRPHYHIILMNCDLNIMPMVYIKNENNTNYYSSKLIEKLWTDENGESIGHNIVARVVKETVSYTTKYTIKKQYGPKSDIYDKLNIIPEFMICSRGIGLDFLEKNIDFLSKCGNMLVSDGVAFASYESLPKYYKKKIKEKNIAAAAKLNCKSAKIAELCKDNILSETSLNFTDYNKVQEEIAKSIYKSKGSL